MGVEGKGTDIYEMPAVYLCPRPGLSPSGLHHSWCGLCKESTEYIGSWRP